MKLPLPIVLIAFLLFLSLQSFSQLRLTGKVIDAATKEPLLSANIAVGTKGTITDFDGNYTLKLDKGIHKITFSYVGYQEVTKTITIENETIQLNVELKAEKTFNEVVITADIAIDRKTPVAFSNVSSAKIIEELAAQDLPMILNSTPGAYATQAGGGDGDARVTIRGFNQRNVAVMLDGIPVNDMENGWVYWSNWFGLDLVTKTVQVQRGLGASKLAIPSVGGTINILTQGIDAKRRIRFRQEIGNDGYFRSTFGITTGRLENGWGISAAGSYKEGNGWVDANFTKGYFYYLRIDKEINDHLISLSGFGAPQEHGQRSFTAPIATYDAEYARELGVNTGEFPTTGTDYGLQYNQHWGYLNGEMYNTRVNYYHKPQFSLRHSWNVSERFFLSNVAYLSIGNGGGTGTIGSMLGNTFRLPDGQLNMDTAFIQNTTPTIFNPDGRSENIIRASVNNHFWYGLLSTARYDLSDQLVLSGGIDLRNYEGDHYREVYDLLGGNYFRSTGNARIDQTTAQLKDGDKFQYDNTGFVRWAGAFGLLEYQDDKWSGFINLSLATTGYSLTDYMKPKVVNLADTTLFITFNGPITYDGTTYTLTAPEAKNQRIDWIWKPSFTFKTGAAFNINDRNSVFVNTGYLSRAPRFINVINDNRFSNFPIQAIGEPENEAILALELGYAYKSSRFSGHLNAYYTRWNNKPLDRLPTVLSDPTDPDSERIPVNINGVAALHQGIELDFIFKATDQLNIEGLAAIGDWIWNSGATAILSDGTTYEFDAKGVHVGDAAQVQLGGLVRYEPIRNAYIKVKATYFAKNYANFNPEDLKTTSGTARRESWKLPSYTLVDLHAGYRFNLQNTQFSLRFNILNLFNTTYISDANNNDRFTQSFNNFDAKSAAVFYGQGLRWSMGLGVEF